MTTWYVARGAGLAALVLLSLSVGLGALVSRPAASTGVAPSAAASERRVLVQYLHRTFAGLGLLALALHLATILADSYAHVGWLGALVPLESGYRPGWVALGTLAAWTFLLVGVTGLARGRLAASPRGVRAWRGVHLASYVGWALAITHGFTSGTDSPVGWVRLLYLACLALVVAAVVVRLSRHRRPAAATPHPPALQGALR